MEESESHARGRHNRLCHHHSSYYYSGMSQFRIDAYVAETLMRDLVQHDRQPSAFLVYLHLWYRSTGRRAHVQASHQSVADATGLSKSAVQAAVRTRARRRLIRATREAPTAVPAYTVLRPWRR